MKKLMFLMVVIIGLLAVSNINAQSIKSYKFGRSTLQPGQSLNPGEGLRSPAMKYAFVLQKDGNLCLYKLERNGDEIPIKCVGEQRGARLDMQQDGNLVLYSGDGEAIWSSDTYRGDNSQKGRHIWMSDTDGKAVQMTAKDGKSYIWNFED